MRLPISWLATGCIAVVLGAPGLLGDEPSVKSPRTNLAPTSAPRDSAVVEELTRLRQEVGQNILSGSVLDGDDSAAAFEGGLRAVLGLPPRQEAAAVETDPGGTAESVTVIEPGDTTSMTVVRSVRGQTILLDELANECEASREYNLADRLREIAQRLRVAVRKLDE